MKFFAGRKDGLGARLLPILNAARLAQKTGADFKFAWPPYPQQHSAKNDFAEEIFHSDFINRHLINKKLIGNDAEKFVSNRERDSSLSIHILENHSEKFISQDNIIFNSPCVIYLLPNESKKDVFSEIKNLLIESALNKQILFHYQAWRENNSLPIAGMHIRLGDVADGPLRQLRYFGSKYYPVSFFEKAYSNIIKNHSFCLCCSNDASVVDYFTKTYGSLFVPSGGLSHIQLVMLEILALSDCKNLYGCQESAFLSCATVLGNACMHDLCSLFDVADLTEMFRQYSANQYTEIAKIITSQFNKDFFLKDLHLLQIGENNPVSLDTSKWHLLNLVSNAKLMAPREKVKLINYVYNSLENNPDLFETFLLVLTSGGEKALGNELLNRFKSSKSKPSNIL